MKKKYLIILIATVLTSGLQCSFGQTSQGNFLIGGESGLSMGWGKSTIKNDDDPDNSVSGTYFSLAPKAGYFILDGLAVGVKMTLATSNRSWDNYDSKSNDFDFGPFVNYYFGQGNIIPFAGVDFGMGGSKEKTTLEQITGNVTTKVTTENKYRDFYYNLNGGLAIMLGEKASIDIGLRIGGAREKQTNDNTNNEKTNSFNANFFGGVSVYL
ncbi:MAG: outer membrane beta-barrel protein [Bacteroidales bacterium]|nr:outer membrane beta-barrel protein [Bacteroidales bacterium]